MIVTTTNQVDGYEISNYLRVVSGETLAGINLIKDFAAGFRNIVGGRSATYEQEITQARETALAEMVQRAQELGAHAIVGVTVSYMTAGNDTMIMVAANGTAVTLTQARS